MARLSHHDKSFYHNSAARAWKHASSSVPDDRILELHRRLPGFAPTPLISVDSIANEIGVKHVFVKQESSRAGLPAFKILGASWATYRAVARAVKVPIGVSLEDLGDFASKRGIKLFAATDGNHGRAVARMAKLLGLESHIFVPSIMDQPTRGYIASEGAQVVIVDGSYDDTVQQARIRSEVPNGLLIQDTAFEGYTEIPQWIVDGYSTMMIETEAQVFAATGSTVSLTVAPVGVGSFAQAVVAYWKSRPHPCAVLTVEPESAACLKQSLINGEPTMVPTDDTIMSGMNCGTVSSIAWPLLKNGVDAAVSISDTAADQAVRKLQDLGLDVGPCGAATYAALESALQNCELVGSLTGEESIVVLFCTEGRRQYKIPGINPPGVPN